jgi:uncharacterized protein
MTNKVAASVVQHRSKIGTFKTKKELLDVKGMGSKRFQQCAGFLRIPDATDSLDRTHVHPESYAIARKLLAQLQKSDGAFDIQKWSSNLETDTKTLEDIEQELGAILKEKIIGYLAEPTLLNSLPKPEQIVADAIVQGVVKNVTTFGMFVDIGAERDGLLHISQV